MKSIRNGFIGILGSLAVGLMVVGALALGLLEVAPLDFPTQIPRPTLPQPNLTPIPGTGATLTFDTPIVLPPVKPTLCPQPRGWEPYIVRLGDNLADLAKLHHSSLEQIMTGNCLVSEMIIPDVMIFLPPLQIMGSETLTQTTTLVPLVGITPVPTSSCQRPTGWIGYTVKQGDNLTRISIAYRISTWYLKQVNCLRGDTIWPGMVLWVPNVPTSTLTATPTATDRPLDTATATPTPSFTSTVIISITPTIPPTETPTFTPTVTATDTPTQTHTPTDTPTDTPTSSPTPTDTPTPTPTDTATPEPTISPTPTETPA